LDFEANLRDGIANDWPIRYQDLAAWYDYVEDFAGISGQAEGLPQLPDGKFLPAMEMTCAEVTVKDAIAKYFAGERLMTIGRTAIITKPHRGRLPCHYCGPCSRGCITRSYFSSLNSTLPAALATGKVTVRPFSVVHSLIFDSQTRKVSGVRVIDGQTHQAVEFKGRIVFLNASTLESTRIFLVDWQIQAASWGTTSWTTAWAAAPAESFPATRTACPWVIAPMASMSRVSAT
jgi:choline dehydrogenase-like flavoprotein